jgi:hypothetical protein
MSGWIVKRDGRCSKCGTVLRAGEPAVWIRGANKMRCMECPTVPAPEASPLPIDLGIAGGSARDRYDRLMAKREAELNDRWGSRVGGLINRFAAEPQPIAAWGIGARGEELLAEALIAVPGLIAMHDRRVPGTRSNIDHIVVAPAGLFVVDAKHYDGMIELRNYGWFLRPDWRLTVGRRDRSKLARAMTWQVEVVTTVLTEAAIDPLPPVTPVLCFVNGRWPIFRPPDEFEGVLLESERSLARRLTQPALLDLEVIDRLAHVIATELPAKKGHKT